MLDLGVSELISLLALFSEEGEGRTIISISYSVTIQETTMHLNECYSIAKDVWESESHPILSVSSPHWECVQSWMLKTTTSFHNDKEMEQRLVEHPWFGLLCFTFSVGGFIMLLLPIRESGRVTYPHYSFASYLLFIQGPLAFLADYVYLTHDHPVHALDRFSAMTLMTLELYRHFAIMSYMRIFPTALGISLSLLVALFSFTQSQRCQSEQNVNGFMFWHSMWHLYPLVCGFIEMYDVYFLGFYAAPKRMKQEEEKDDVVRRWETQIAAKFGVRRKG